MAACPALFLSCHTLFCALVWSEGVGITTPCDTDALFLDPNWLRPFPTASEFAPSQVFHPCYGVCDTYTWNVYPLIADGLQ